MAALAPILARLGLGQYLDRFVAEGFDTWGTLLEITEGDLEELDVKLGHRRKLQREIAISRGAIAGNGADPRPANRPTVDGQNGDGERVLEDDEDIMQEDIDNEDEMDMASAVVCYDGTHRILLCRLSKMSESNVMRLTKFIWNENYGRNVLQWCLENDEDIMQDDIDNKDDMDMASEKRAPSFVKLREGMMRPRSKTQEKSVCHVGYRRCLRHTNNI
ncbi:MAG: hypothetical protein Q9195_008236 [Heterodermia aff. obscurata]